MEFYPVCKTCKHYRRHTSWGLMHPGGRYEPQTGYGDCDILSNGGALNKITIGNPEKKKKPPVDVYDTFGCVLHEPRQ